MNSFMEFAQALPGLLCIGALLLFVLLALISSHDEL